jgi:hypothetical protein
LKWDGWKRAGFTELHYIRLALLPGENRDPGRVTFIRISKDDCHWIYCLIVGMLKRLVISASIRYYFNGDHPLSDPDL